ncbi:endothelin-converting enzyme 2-like [Ixodes scapularis]|uniref:endothelin-converting enzyme 2-like n=1 Tax=Ixodes scapularis TaxID=6945 RepID=UPI001A9F0061|nr:endothelin-converting enzyme 2-like [Ixodes scapularis]
MKIIHLSLQPDHHQDYGISSRTEDKNFQRLLGGFMVALFVGLSLLVLGVLFSLHIVRGAPLMLTPGPWCTSDGCLQQAGYLQRSANTSVRPCQDFYSFVCHNWAPDRNSQQVEYIADVPAEMRNHWRLKNAALLFNGSLEPPSFERASAVFKACILRTEKDQTSDLEKFKTIMRDAGIPWPDDPSSLKHPLAVLLDLDANLGAPVWFKVRVQGDLGSPRVVIEPNYLYDTLYKGLDKPTSIKRMAEFHQMYGTQPNTTELEESADLDMLIATSLRDSLENRENNPQLTSIGDLHHITPDINSSYWLSLFNHHFEQALLENNDAILIQNAQLLSSITFFVGNISNKKMLHVIGWWFAQLYTSVADVRALRIIFGALDKNLLGAICLHQIKQRYGAAVLTGYVGSQFTKEHKTAVERVLNSVQIQLTNKLRSVNWTTETRREEMLEKVNSTRIYIWPSPAFEVTFNETFPEAPSSYFDFWATRTKSLREQKASQKKRRNDINLLPGYTDPMFSYDQWENAVSISLATLSPPWYYKDGSAAIIYGTLGWHFARTLSMAIVSTVSLFLKT